MAERKSPIDLLLDFCVFAPAGFLMNIRDVIPDLAAKGREHFDAQCRRMRSTSGADVVGGAARAAQHLRPIVGFGGRRESGESEVADEPWAGEPEADIIPFRTELNDDGPESEDPAGLAIPGYDSLAASQVVTRLAGLTADELEAVRRYESAHRGRKTVLGKISQLQAG
jgi:hypothetical protein